MKSDKYGKLYIYPKGAWDAHTDDEKNEIREEVTHDFIGALGSAMGLQDHVYIEEEDDAFPDERGIYKHYIAVSIHTKDIRKVLNDGRIEGNQED